MEQRDFFISYTGADETWAVWIAGVLKRNGYTAYAQFSDINPGDNFLEKMEEFVENSANFIAVWSKAYSESPYCMTEFRAAFYEWKENRMKCLLPVRVDGHPMKRLYSPLVRVDLSDMSAASEKNLMDAILHAAPYSVTALNIDGESLFRRGYDYHFGVNGVTQNYAKALDYYEQAAKKGNAEALYSLGYLYDNAKDYAKALDYYEQAAAKGSANALKCLGDFYKNGFGVAQDYVKARKYYKRAAEKGSAVALYNMGIFYEYGLGVKIDYHKSFTYYQRAAKAGHDRASAQMRTLLEKLNPYKK